MSGNSEFTADSYTFTGEHEFYDEGNGTWRIEFLASGTLVVNMDVDIDVYCVGGGGGGGRCQWGDYYGGTCGGGGGGGGYTSTVGSVSISANTAYSIDVGSGGPAPSLTTYDSMGGAPGSNGGASTAFNISANGGIGGSQTQGTYNGGHKGQAGGNGGSGGGGGSCYGYAKYGAVDGASDGGSPSETKTYNGAQAALTASGQGRTTRDFGEYAGTLRCGGGGGAGGRFRVSGNEQGQPAGVGGNGGGGNGGRWYDGVYTVGTDGETNYGGGGGGGLCTGSANATNVSRVNGRAGGSGIVIIRSHR